MGALLLHFGALAALATWARTSSGRAAPEASPLRTAELSIELEASAPPPQAQRALPAPVEASRTANDHRRVRSSALAARSGVASAHTEPARPSELEGPPAASAPRTPNRGLSLAQLGIGAATFPYPLDDGAPVSEAEWLAQRLNASLSASLALGDSARGLGMEGPALRAVTELAMNSALPLTTTARLLLVVNGAGITESVSVLDAGADRAEWQRVAEELRRKLARQALRVPANSAGARLQLVVSSRPLSVSGAQPGLDPELFGKAKRTGAARVGRLSVLPRQAEAARAQFPVLEDSHPKIMSGFSNNLLSGGADLAELAGSQRRSVSAQLARLDWTSAGEQPDPEHVSQ